jgi:YbgC/YbaW family acyl-CoA thioester hydrolase
VIYEYKLLIQESHLDTFGHINNATYLEIYEEARWDLITANGYGLNEIQRSQKSPIILEVNLKFLKEIRLREKITVTTEMLGYKGKIGQLKQQMKKESGEIASEAIFTMGLFDLANRKLIDPTPEWNRAIGFS